MVLATVAHANLRHGHFGITCIIAPSYADVFFNNTFKNGMLTLAITVQSTLEKVTKEAKAGSEIEVDLLNQEMKDAWGEKLADFEVEEFRKHCFVNGFDDIGLTMQMEDPIGKFESRRTMNTPCLNGSGYLKRGNTSGSVKLEAVPVPKGNRAEEIDEPLEG